MDKTIIGKLKVIQAREKLSDGGMAKRLGCSRQLWQGTRAGDTPLGMKVLKGVSAAFPNLKDDVEIFLSNSANKLPSNANNHVRGASEAQGRGLKRFFGGLVVRIKKLAKSGRF